ncbi:hypothetical protein AMIS_58220 [Actinoplanes missouriensis 431]|uniref:Uncharacterized protein n=1 Tax=Actinoplanes missouriensis (strain ATCC 14538 / DSM 43046 / CBS 188.64 / JCM 3121 / NBRC 102363 / NCIMB 12654 / NRRL B-3342 / UNCC 431) TaxID=512565 RepID=I0HDF5_ACTM4|nr:hypothetical protein [Actinoplanes missouriensis]BAL91042.1 hypothetical protein AMIS_58220 [Actinoplanes missouriensis 431]
MELHWWSIEVLDGPQQSAARWQDSCGTALVEAAVAHGAYEWSWVRQSWGVVFEIGFRAEGRWESYRRLAVVGAALDAVPDPVNGLLIYPGRGGSSGRVQPRRPRPVSGAGAVAVPVGEEGVSRRLWARPGSLITVCPGLSRCSPCALVRGAARCREVK